MVSPLQYPKAHIAALLSMLLLVVAATVSAHFLLICGTWQVRCVAWNNNQLRLYKAIAALSSEWTSVFILLGRNLCRGNLNHYKPRLAVIVPILACMLCPDWCCRLILEHPHASAVLATGSEPVACRVPACWHVFLPMLLPDFPPCFGNSLCVCWSAWLPNSAVLAAGAEPPTRHGCNLGRQPLARPVACGLAGCPWAHKPRRP